MGAFALVAGPGGLARLAAALELDAVEPTGGGGKSAPLEGASAPRGASALNSESTGPYTQMPEILGASLPLATASY